MAEASAISEHLEHAKINVAGSVINIDTVLMTLLVAGIILIIGLVLMNRITAGVPGGLQNFIEMVFEFIGGLVKQNISVTSRFFGPLAITLFVFILLSNYIGLLPWPSVKVGEWVFKFESPTTDLNLPLAMALAVFILVHYYGFKVKGFAYINEFYLHPFPVPHLTMNPLTWLLAVVMVILNIVMRTIEELAKPISLAMRLFGNMFAGAIIAVLILSLIPWFLSWTLGGVWLAFHLFVGAIQAFVFTMLTIVYIALATQKVENH